MVIGYGLGGGVRVLDAPNSLLGVVGVNCGFLLGIGLAVETAARGIGCLVGGSVFSQDGGYISLGIVG